MQGLYAHGDADGFHEAVARLAIEDRAPPAAAGLRFRRQEHRHIGQLL